jgi:hypothetical protein
MESGTQFFQRELIMFVHSVHYSDYLEQDLCIQDVLCQVNWCLAVRDKKFMHNMITGHSYTTKTCLSDISCSACIKFENLFGNLFAVLFIHVTCDDHLSSQCWNHARKYAAMHLQSIFNRKKLTVS